MRLLFITSNRIGDAVLSTSPLSWLAEQHPDLTATVACGPAPAPLFAAMPFVERVIVMTKRKRAGHWLDLWRQAVPVRWDMVVDLRSSATAYLLRAKERKVLPPGRFEAHQLVRMARLFGLAEPPLPRLWVTDAALAAAERLMAGSGPVVAVAPTANWAAKAWPADRFGAAIARLVGPGGVLPDGRVAVFGAANERLAAQAFLDTVPSDRLIDLIGRIALPEVAACLGRCDLFVGNDSGLMHMAAAMRIPTLGLFGPSPERLYGPWGALGAAVRGPRSFEDICNAPDFDHRNQASLMLDLSVDAVVTEAEALLARVRRNAQKADADQ